MNPCTWHTERNRIANRKVKVDKLSLHEMTDKLQFSHMCLESVFYPPVFCKFQKAQMEKLKKDPNIKFKQSSLHAWTRWKSSPKCMKWMNLVLRINDAVSSFKCSLFTLISTRLSDLFLYILEWGITWDQDPTICICTALHAYTVVLMVVIFIQFKKHS